MMCQPYVVCTGAESSFFLSENATLSNGATVCPFEIVSFPPCAAEPGSFEYFFASFAKSPPLFSCVSMRVGELLVVHEDVAHVAARGLRVRRLVRVVVRLDVGVRDLHAAGHLRVELLREDLPRAG